jgi:hypothetical protein
MDHFFKITSNSSIPLLFLKARFQIQNQISCAQISPQKKGTMVTGDTLNNITLWRINYPQSILVF